MTARSNGSVEADRRVVGVADYTVATGGETLVAYGLGTCVGIGLSDPEAGVAALGHTMLPRQPADSAAEPGKFADETIRTMLREAVAAGAGYGAVEAWLVGGAEVFPLADLDLPAGTGDRTVAVAREQLETLDVPVVAEAVGGDQGRTVEFDTATGAVRVRRAGQSEPEPLRKTQDESR